MVDLVVGGSSESVDLAPVGWWLTTPLTRIFWVDWCLWLEWLVDRVVLAPGKWVDLVSRWFGCLGVWWVYRSMTRWLGGLVGWWLWHLDILVSGGLVALAPVALPTLVVGGLSGSVAQSP